MFINFHAYEASAGSGKTFSLVVRYLSLLFAGEDAEKILALTFTNKAANEMQERIKNTLINLDEKDELHEIAKVLEISKEQILSQKEEVLKTFLKADTKVMTLDKFFAKVLRKFSLHVGLMPNFSTFESQHELKVIIKFLTLVKNNGQEDALISLSILAAKRLSGIFDLLNELYAKKNEMKDISFESLDFTVFEQKVMESSKKLQTLFEKTDLNAKALSTMQAEDINDLLNKSWIEKDTLKYWQYKKFFHEDMDKLLFEIKENLYYYMKAKEEHFFSELFSLLDTYIESKQRVAKEDDELSFDDITYFVYDLLKNRIDSEFLYFRLDAKIDHMLLDEFQDTSIIQYDILSPLIEELSSGKGSNDRSSLFLVGDVKQSIYRFRGGKKELFYTATDANNVTVEQLTTNYRSEKEVVEFVNRTFIDKIKNYVPQNVKKGAVSGYVEVVENEEVLQEMLEKVKFLVEKGADINEIAILTATNANGSAVQELLKENGIDVVTETTSKLINQKNILALIEYLKYSYFKQPIYKENFFKLIGQKSQKLSTCRIDTTDLALELKNVIIKYNIYDGDMNIFSFIEKLASYKDIESFLYEYERLDAGAAQEELNGVRVLTVHKSKGLEYEHVLVLDRLGRKKSDSSPIIYEYDGIKLKNIYLRMNKRTSLDEEYNIAIEKEKVLSSEDDLNAMYVAFTRAKESLFVIKKPKESKFENLDLEVASYGSFDLKEKKIEKKELFSDIAFEDRYYGTQKDLLSLVKNDKEEHKAIQFGLCMHYTLEMMNKFEASSLQTAMFSSKNRFGAILEDEDFIEIEKRVKSLLNNEKFKELTDGKIFKEKAISYNKELRYIDLLVEKEDEWIIIDYKSADHNRDSYIKQVGFYKKAVQSITKNRVKSYICYLLENDVKFLEVL